MTDTRTCAECGKTFTPFQPHHRTCRDCFRSQGSGGAPPPRQHAGPPRQQQGPATTSFRLDEHYLADGYFHQRDGQEVVRDEVIDKLAEEVAIVLGRSTPKITAHQLRRFYNQARGMEARLLREQNFATIRPQLLKLKSAAAYQTGRELISEQFLHFLTKNIDLAVVDERSFRQGFLPHFESVLSYFVYHFRESSTRR